MARALIVFFWRLIVAILAVQWVLYMQRSTPAERADFIGSLLLGVVGIIAAVIIMAVRA